MGISIEYKGWKFEFDSIPTPADLEARYQERVAALQKKRDDVKGREQGVLEGEAPLSPMQKWFFAHEFAEPSHWNHGIVYRPRERFEPEVWRRAWRGVLEQHDALRCRYRPTGSGWEQVYGALPDEVGFEVVDLRGTPEDELDDAVDERVRLAHTELDIERGPLAKMTYLDVGADRPPQIVLVVHHLAIGGFSWTILAGDLQEAAAREAAGEAVNFPDKGTSFRYWARALSERELSPEDVEYWLDGRFEDAAFAPPADLDADRGVCLEGTASSVRIEVGDVVGRLKAQDREPRTAMLAALMEALWDWSDSDRVAIALEGHARDEKLVPDTDLSRTIGWFNTMFAAGFERRPDEESYESVARQLDDIPAQTLWYMAARHAEGSDEWREALASQPEPEVLFNYYGALEGEDAQRAIRDVAAMRSTKNHRTHLHEMYFYHDGHSVFLEWVFSPEINRRETIQQRAEAFSMHLTRIANG
jgi:hypothetical protein